MFNFYEVLAGLDLVTDSKRATTCSRKIEAPSLQTKSTKKEGLSGKMAFNWKTVWRFQTKKTQYTSSVDQTTHETRGP